MNPITDRILAESKYIPAFVFDIDGVLASYEYEFYNHGYPETVWNELTHKSDPYLNARPFKIMQQFVSTYLDDCYVCSIVQNDEESKHKMNFIKQHYDISFSKMYFVDRYEKKLEILQRIQELRKETDPHHIIMIEDTIKNLDYIKERSEFATVHVSSFFE